MKQISADYLVIGSGAVSMTFVDTMLAETDETTFVIVDRHALPGGHWNDAYPFVRLHQPSSFYGVASTALGNDRIDESGSNKGYYELASGAEVLSYFDRVMRERLLASGRVQYFPLHEYRGDGVFGALLSDETYSVRVNRRIVDGTFFNTTVPSTHERKFSVAPGVTCVAPNDLPKLAGAYRKFAVLGGGKTAMDAAVWLLDHGAPAEAISWVCPRASWLINRATTQPGKRFFAETVGGIANQFEAMVAATSPEDLFLRLEAAGVMMRIDRDIVPSMFHHATSSVGEVEQLARIENVIHGERVASLARGEIAFESGRGLAVAEDTLFIDCTACAVRADTYDNPPPVFEEGKLTLQAVYAPIITYGAAIIARIEAQFEDDATKNALSAPVRLADTPYQWMSATAQSLMNQNGWNQTPQMRDWIKQCRLNPAAQAIAEGSGRAPGDAALLERVKASAFPAVMNMHKLLAEFPDPDGER